MIINTKDLKIEYGTYTAIHNVNISIKKGEIVYLLGPNGGGKTTLVKAITGILKPSFGTIDVLSDKIGYLPQSIKLKKDFPITVFEVIYSGFYKQYLFPTKKQKNTINQLLLDMEILNCKNKLINDLSGGQLQRVLLCRALVNEPEILILDEPTNALDINFKTILNKYIEKLNREKNTTIIIITHDLSGINHVECKNEVIYVDKTVKFMGKFCDYHKEYLKRMTHNDSIFDNN